MLSFCFVGKQVTFFLIFSFPFIASCGMIDNGILYEMTAYAKKRQKGDASMGETAFWGGFHRNNGKDLSKEKPIAALFPKGDAVYPMQQHIGLPAKPVVAVGDKVLVGQRIGEANGVVSAHVLSGVSGRVKAIEERMTVSGNMCESVVIENDGAFATVEGFGTKRDFTMLTKEEIRRYVKEAGIVGLGGTGFPTHVKLTPKRDEAVEYVIINGMECEPYLTADERLMTEEGKKLVDGVKIILRLFENAKAVITVGDDKKEVIKVLSDLVKKEDRITIKAIKAKYPLGAERQLIRAVTGRKLNASMIPADVGCVVHNVGTVLAVYRAVAETIPLIRRVVTVTGDGAVKPQNFQVCLGTSFEELLEAAGGANEDAELFLAGGPMRGVALPDLSVAMTKTVSAFTMLEKKDAAEEMTSHCIRCGRCMEICPENLVPQRLMRYAENSDKDRFARFGGMECCECGSCSYVCPAGRPLTQSFRQMRRNILDERRKR